MPKAVILMADVDHESGYCFHDVTKMLSVPMRDGLRLCCKTAHTEKSISISASNLADSHRSNVNLTCFVQVFCHCAAKAANCQLQCAASSLSAGRSIAWQGQATVECSWEVEGPPLLGCGRE